MGAGEAWLTLSYDRLGFIIQPLLRDAVYPSEGALTCEYHFNGRCMPSIHQLIAFFIEIFNTVRPMRFLRFYIIWTAITAAAVIYVAWVIGHATTPVVQQAKKAPIPHARTPRSAWRSRLTALAALAVFLLCYISLMLTWEDFAYYDNSMFTSGTLIGHDLTPMITPDIGGRFIPLGHQEHNLIRHFTDTATGYQVLPIVQLLIFSYILLTLDSDLGIMARAALAVLALLTPSILLSFGALIAFERSVLFFFACLLLSVKRFEETQSIAWAVVAVVCAQFMLYYKETAFLLLFGFAVGRLILRCRNGRDAEWDYDRLWDKESHLDLCLAALAVVFLLFYFAVMGIHNEMNYAVARQQSLTEIVLAYLRLDILAWLFVVVVLGRVYLILRCRVAAALLWDGLALGGVACFLAYVIGLRIFGAIYLAPVDLIAVLYVGRFAVLSWKKMRWWGKLSVSILAFTVLLQDVSFSTFGVFERKNVIHAKAEIASVVRTRYRNRGGDTLRLFFPFANPYVIMEFGSYLNYRGVPVEGAVGAPGGRNSVVLVTPALAKDGRCWPDGPDIRCRAASGPAPGDLVIVLPDDEASLAEASLYREGEQLLFYEPRPSIPHWLYSLAANVVGRLTIAAVRLSHKTLADRWMDGSVTLWK